MREETEKLLREKRDSLISETPNIWQALEHQQERLVELETRICTYLENTEGVRNQEIPFDEVLIAEPQDSSCAMKNRINDNTRIVNKLIHKVDIALKTLEL